MDRHLRAALFFFALFVALVVVAILTCGFTYTIPTVAP